MDEYLLKNHNSTLYLKGCGRLTSQNSDEFKKLVVSHLEKGSTTVLLDLSKCTYMDSTFLGILVGFHKKLRGQGSFTVVRPSSEAVKHLKSMHLDKLIRIIDSYEDFPEEMVACGQSGTKNAEDILGAHKNLMAISESNKKKFRMLAEVLEREIRVGTKSQKTN